MNSGGGQTNISIISEFFNSQSAAGDVSSALADNAVWFKIAIYIIMAVGAIAMAIWIARIAIDILLIVTRGMQTGQSKWRDTLQNFGTKNGEDNYDSAFGYIKGNIVEIILVIILITLLMGGYLFRLVALAISGIGTLGQKLFGLDLGGKFSALDAQAFAEQVKVQKAASLRNQYDEQLASSRQYANQLYEMAKNGAISDDPKFNQMKSHYTQSMVKANILSSELLNRGNNVVAEFKLGKNYFKQHLRQNGDGVCNDEFFVEDIIETFNVGGADANVSCTR